MAETLTKAETKLMNNALKQNQNQNTGTEKDAANSSRHSSEHASDPDTDVEAPNQSTVERARVLTTNDRPYSTFTIPQKASIVVISTLGACFSGFSSNVYLPAIDTISRALRISVSQINLTITSYMIFQSIAPSFISAVADVHGRRPAYLIGFTIYILANLGLGLNNSYAGLLVLRCLQSCGSSGLVTLNQGTLADIVTSAERGKYISITSISSVLAPSVAPIAGGLLSQHLGWHSIFWFLVIASGIYFLPLALFFPETGRRMVGDGSIRPPRWNRCLTDVIRQKKGSFKHEDDLEAQQQVLQQSAPGQKPNHINVFAAFSILADPETAIVLICVSLMYAAFYAISTSLTVQFGRIYHLNSSQQGLLFLPQALGTVFAAGHNSKMIDRRYRHHAEKTDLPVNKSKQINILTTHLCIERARLEIAIPMLTISCIGTISYGWLLYAEVSIAGPIVVLVLNAFTFMSAFSALSVLVIDLHRRRSATASAASNLVRCMLGAGASAVVNPMIERLGLGWCFTFVGLTVLLCVPLMIFLCVRGPNMRRARAEQEQKREKERERRESERQEGSSGRSGCLSLKISCFAW